MLNITYCINYLVAFLNFFRTSIYRSDLLIYLTIILAFLAYRYPIEKSTKELSILLEDLPEELKKMADWLEGKYPKGSFKDRKSYLPSIIWFPIPFDSLKELIKRRLDEVYLLSKELGRKISSLNRKIEIYNSYVEEEKAIILSDINKSQRLLDRLNGPANDPKINDDEFNIRVSELKKNGEEDLYILATNLFDRRKARHEDLIGDDNNPDGLYSLRKSIIKEVNQILESQSYRPWFIKMNPRLLLFISFTIFLIIELCFKTST